MSCILRASDVLCLGRRRERGTSSGGIISQGRSLVKALLAAALAVSTLVGSAVAVDSAQAAAVKVVVKPGYPYYHNGAHYRYSYGGRYYNTRVKKCVIKFHRKVCKWSYR